MNASQAILRGLLLLSAWTGLSVSEAAAQGPLRARGRALIGGLPGAIARPENGLPPGLLYSGRRPARALAPYGIEGGGPLAGYRGPYPLGQGLIIVRRRAAPASGGATEPLPTTGQLRAMGDAELLNALASLAARLDAEVARFNTGATWQRYLRLPDDALPPPTDDNRVVLGVDALAATLARFESVAANPQYVQISGLPSFAAMHAALGEAVRRYGDVDGQWPEDERTEAPTYAARPRIPPAEPRPLTEDSDLVGQSLEMRQLHSAPRETASSDTTPSGEATAGNSRAAEASEELPTPPPSLAPPENAPGGERSVLAE